MTENYDSRRETLEHIRLVEAYLSRFQILLRHRGELHDRSKLEPPEKPIFDEYTPKLKSLTYGSEEYKQALDEMRPALIHHYGVNRHHPEHFAGGVLDMSLIDLIEMLCDWKAAVERHDDGDLCDSLVHNKKRFELGDSLFQIILNTALELHWITRDQANEIWRGVQEQS